VDLLPTVLNLLGLAIPPEVEGLSLLPLLDQDLPWREVFSYLDLDGNRAESVYAHPWKLIRSDSENGEQGRFELYDHSHRSKDEGERSSQAPIIARYLQKALDRHKENPFRLPAREMIIDEVMEHQLKALGYLH
jgi:arylsulfatase A-like enzyme